jgi:hypothetical protein
MLSSLPELVQPVPQAAWTGNRGQSNSLVSELILTGILGRDSAMSLTYAVRWHHNSSRRKSGSPYKSLQTFPGEQNSSRRGKMISKGSAGAAAGSSDIFGPSMYPSFSLRLVSSVFVVWPGALVILRMSSGSSFTLESFHVRGSPVRVVDPALRGISFFT